MGVDGGGAGGLGVGLTIVGVDAELDFPLDGSLDLLLPHALDAQVVEAAWGEGRLSEEAGVALTPRRDPKIAPCLGACSLGWGAKAPQAQGSQPWGGVWGSNPPGASRFS